MKDIVINKIQNIQRCVRRAREEYQADRDGFAANYTRQDAALLNVLRACETAIDLAKARHADFLASPYVIVDPAIRWFPAPTGEALRGASMDGLMRPLTGNAHSGGAMSSISQDGPT